LFDLRIANCRPIPLCQRLSPNAVNLSVPFALFSAIVPISETRLLFGAKNDKGKVFAGTVEDRGGVTMLGVPATGTISVAWDRAETIFVATSTALLSFGLDGALRARRTDVVPSKLWPGPEIVIGRLADGLHAFSASSTATPIWGAGAPQGIIDLAVVSSTRAAALTASRVYFYDGVSWSPELLDQPPRLSGPVAGDQSAFATMSATDEVILREEGSHRWRSIGRPFGGPANALTVASGAVFAGGNTGLTAVFTRADGWCNPLSANGAKLELAAPTPSGLDVVFAGDDADFAGNSLGTGPVRLRFVIAPN
jgi:hypothetical protein